MSEPTTERRGVRGRFSRWRARSRGRSTLKAAYAQAARDVKRMDPAVRERIGRANLSPADLQHLASLHVGAQFRPGQFGDISQRLGEAAADRLQGARSAPRQPRLTQTRNPVRQVVNRYSRWGRNERRGTKALKAALQQAARDVKRTDPAVQLAIGRSGLNSSDLAAMASGRMDQVFRPEGRFQGAPGQQAGAGQSPQSDQLSERIAALQESIAANQTQIIALMEENNRLQAEMRQLVEARVQQIQQQVSDLNQSLTPAGRQAELPSRQSLNDDVRLDNPVIPDQQQPDPQQPQADPHQPQSPTQDPQAATQESQDPTQEPQAGTQQPQTGAEQPQTGPQEPRTGTQRPEPGAQQPQAGTQPAQTGSQETGAQQPQTGGQQPQVGEQQGRGGDQLAAVQRMTSDGAIRPPTRSTQQQATQTAAASDKEAGNRTQSTQTRNTPTREGR